MLATYGFILSLDALADDASPVPACLPFLRPVLGKLTGGILYTNTDTPSQRQKRSGSTSFGSHTTEEQGSSRHRA